MLEMSRSMKNSRKSAQDHQLSNTFQSLRTGVLAQSPIGCLLASYKADLESSILIRRPRGTLTLSIFKRPRSGSTIAEFHRRRLIKPTHRSHRESGAPTQSALTSSRTRSKQSRCSRSEKRLEATGTIIYTSGRTGNRLLPVT